MAGPSSRSALEPVLGESWREPLARLNHMDFADGQYGGRELRLLRASFSGELAFELHCRPASALALWEALLSAGLTPYGIDALDVLRVEKGYLVGAEINGETTPFDLGMEAPVQQGNARPGRELLDRPALTWGRAAGWWACARSMGRRGFLAGAQLTATETATRPAGTSPSVFSRHWRMAGLALVAGISPLTGDPYGLIRRSDSSTPRHRAPAHFDPDGAA